MKKIHILSVVGIALTLGACDYNDKNFDGLDELVKPAHVLKEKYTLAEADYAAISDNSTNKKIAEEAGVGKALGYVKTDLYLSGTIPGATYLPAFIANKYFTADKGSSVKITYNYKESKSELLSDYSSIKLYTPSNKVYANIYGNTEFAPYLNETTKNKVTDLLKGYENPKEGDVVFVDYRLSKGNATTDLLKTPLLWENFESSATEKLTSLKDWMNGGDWFISSKGDAEVKVTSYDANQYVQISGSKAKGACEAWLITPEITLGTNDLLSFDVNVGNWNANCLSVLISTTFDGSNVDAAGIWTDITSSFAIPNKPEKGYGKFASAGKYNLSAYNGSKIRIAFKYVGDGANEKTTTYQIDNIMVGTDIPDKGGLNSEPAYALKVYNDKGEWKNQDKKVYVLAYKDYVNMGISSLNFTSDKLAVNYIPVYMAKQVAYPLDGETRIVVYRYYNGKELKIYSDEYIYSAETGKWELNKQIIEKTEQYVLNNGKWNFDPSTVITLKAEKENAESKAFYQAIVDYVGKTYGTDYYQTGYTNAEFYFGASSYQNNFSFSTYSWRKSNKAGATAYKDMSDEELTNLMFERLPEAIRVALVALYGDADAVKGVEVTYTVNFSIYDGKDTKVYTIQYLVTGKGVFEYVEDSLKEVTE